MACWKFKKRFDKLQTTSHSHLFFRIHPIRGAGVDLGFLGIRHHLLDSTIFTPNKEPKGKT